MICPSSMTEEECPMKALRRIGPAACLTLLLTGCASSEKWGWYVINPMTKQGRINTEFLLSGVQWTVVLTLACVALSVVLGFLLYLPRVAENRYLDALNRGLVELFRSIPPLVSILWVYYGLPVLTGVDLNPFVSGMVALSLYGAAFMAENLPGRRAVHRARPVRGGGQHRAVHVRQADVRDLPPRALRRCLPAMGNQFVILLKMSSLVSVIGLAEVVRRANELSVTEYRPSGDLYPSSSSNTWCWCCWSRPGCAGWSAGWAPMNARGPGMGSSLLVESSTKRRSIVRRPAFDSVTAERPV